jgi:hypothetical protein
MLTEPPKSSRRSRDNAKKLHVPSTELAADLRALFRAGLAEHLRRLVHADAACSAAIRNAK